MELKTYERTNSSIYSPAAKASVREQEAEQWRELFQGSVKGCEDGLPWALENVALNAIRKDGTLWLIQAVNGQPSRSFGAYRLTAQPWLEFKSFRDNAGNIHGQAIGGQKLFQTWGTLIAEQAWDAFNSLADANSSETSAVILPMLEAITDFYNAGRLVADSQALPNQLLFKESMFESAQFAGVIYAQPITVLAEFEVRDGRVADSLESAGWKAYDTDEAQEWLIANAHLDTTLFTEHKRYEKQLRFLEGNGQRVRPYRSIDQRGKRAAAKSPNA